jgi:transcriptional regulator with XRE-family HTH domain
MDRVRNVLRKVVKPNGPHSQRGLARKAGLDRDAVYDIIQGRNRNPSVNVLAALAAAIDKDLSVFGADVRHELPSAAELQQAILESLPAMPRRGSWEKKASFLAEAVARILELPPAQPSIASEPVLSGKRARAGVVPPRAPTRRGGSAPARNA